MAREVDGRRVTRIDLVEKFLPLGVESGQVDVLVSYHLEAERRQCCLDRSRVVDGTLKLLSRSEVVVPVDADHEGDTLFSLCPCSHRQYRQQQQGNGDPHHGALPSMNPEQL